MSTYKKCDNSVAEMASELLNQFESHEPTITNKVKIDFLFACPEYDDVSGEPKSDAIKHNGCKALGVCRKISLKDRAKGMGDVEITLDGDWWEKNDDEDRRALLDHELHHIVATDKRDDLGRPIIKMRKHDYDFGWFAVIAHRHGAASIERKQAKTMMEIGGQFFWPDFAPKVGNRMGNLEMTVNA